MPDAEEKFHTPTPKNEINEKSESLFNVCVNIISDRMNKTEKNIPLMLPFLITFNQVHAKDVVSKVLKKFRKKGWIANHSCKFGHNGYNFLKVCPDKDLILRTLSE